MNTVKLFRSAIGPLIGMWLVYQTGSAEAEAATRTDVQLIIFFGAVSVVIGFVCLGHRIMRVIGKEITEISAARQVKKYWCNE
jgi:phosphate/sulfate permease